MIRILHIVGRMDRAGAETMIMNLYRVLDRTRFQFDFLYFTDDRCDFDDEIESLGGRTYRLPMSRYRNPISRMFALKRLLMDNRHLQIIHCHTLFSNAFHLWAGQMAGIKFRIAHSHNTSDLSKGRLLSKTYHALSKHLMKLKATHFMACGEEAGRFLFPGINKVQLFPNSIDTLSFAETARDNRDYLRKMLNLPKDVLVIIQIGRLREVKNHQFAIGMAAYMERCGIKFHLVFAGDGHLRKDLEALALDYRLEEKITFLGVRADIPLLLAGADLMLMPSLHEGFPVVLIESQAAGKPALIADTISREVDLGVGLVDFESLAQPYEVWRNKLQRLIYQPRLGDQERLKILRDRGFDIHQSIQQLEQIYSDLGKV